MTNFKPQHLIRANVFDLEAYTPIVPFEVLSQQLGRHPQDIIKLDANENPYGPSPRVAEALAEAAYLHIYPDPESRALRDSLADYTGLPADYLMVGHGADELIDLTMRLFLEPGDAIITCPPTFGMYRFDAAINAAQVVKVTRDADFSMPIDSITTLFNGLMPPKLLFITSPNNPDGSLISDADLKQLLDLPVIVILDEAYVEFSGQSRIHWVPDYDNLIVLRSFSKWAGLAGLRVGYGAYPLPIIEHLWKIKQPYNVNLAGQIAAQVSLEDRERLLGTVMQLIETRETCMQQLLTIPWLKPYPSHANFVLCKVIDRSALEVKTRLAEHGILVRYYQSAGLTDHIRISMGLPAHMHRLVEILQQL